TSFGEFSFQRFWSDAGEPKPVPVHRVVVLIFTRNAGEFGAAFVQNAGEDDITSKTHPRTARRSLGQVGTGIHRRGTLGCNRVGIKLHRKESAPVPTHP